MNLTDFEILVLRICNVEAPAVQTMKLDLTEPDIYQKFWRAIALLADAKLIVATSEAVGAAYEATQAGRDYLKSLE